ncbi:MAG TPA: 16S rRNA (guanine(966)-N(2))-methyltransferase RsmD [Deltaproteobacteria bacterium]|nr:16S rRNA (guanine(966)-N(2))-methyltransferase RsmD [Deltaproteobacteria bacterium]
MRIISGSAKGTPLAAPRGMLTRPTSDRVREALFSIIQSRLDLSGMSVVDICAGTGALGIEALSRGAGRCSFVEHNTNALKCIKTNLAASNCQERGELLPFDALKALKLFEKRGDRFDLVFFDPPYASELYACLPEQLCSLGLMAVDSLLVMECSSRNILPEHIGCMVKSDRRVYGDTALEFYVLEEV